MHHRVSCSYTSKQNGHTERKHGHITESTLTMVFNTYAPTSLWVDAFSSIVYIINRLPSKLLKNQSSFEILFGTPPTTISLEFLAVDCFLIFVIICHASFLQTTILAYSSVIAPAKKVTDALTHLQIAYIHHVMLNLMNIFSSH